MFIARNAPRYAEIFANRVFEAADRLAEFPLMGRVVPEIGREEIREIIVQGYRIIYRLSGDEAEILTLHHGARLLAGPQPPDNA